MVFVLKETNFIALAANWKNSVLDPVYRCVGQIGKKSIIFSENTLFTTCFVVPYAHSVRENNCVSVFGPFLVPKVVHFLCTSLPKVKTYCEQLVLCIPCS